MSAGTAGSHMRHDRGNGGRDISHEPQIQARAAQRYAAIPMTVTMDSISDAVDQAFPELFGWLAGNGLAASGPPFIRYLVIDMAAEMEIELGVPVDAPVAGSGRVRLIGRQSTGTARREGLRPQVVAFHLSKAA